MPGRAEYGLLAGLGQGIAQAGQMAYADHLQQMREARLAKIASEAADGKFARDKELLGMETANRREELDIRNEAELGLVDARANTDVKSKKELADYYISKGLGADGRAIKSYTPKFKAISDGYGVVTGYVDENSGKAIDLTTKEGRAEWEAYQSFLRGGVDIGPPKKDQPENPPPKVAPPPRAVSPAAHTPPSQQLPANVGLLSQGLSSAGKWASDALYNIAPDGIRAARDGRL